MKYKKELIKQEYKISSKSGRSVNLIISDDKLEITSQKSNGKFVFKNDRKKGIIKMWADVIGLMGEAVKLADTLTKENGQ